MSRIAPAIALIASAALCGAATLSPQDPPSLAAGVLQQTDLARQAVRSRNQDAALRYVANAQTLMAGIQAQTAGQPPPVLIPVQETTETTTTYTDVKRSKGGELTASRMKRNTHISLVQQQTNAAELNVAGAQANLDAAQAALRRADWSGADTALAGILNLVQTSGANAPVPLLQARQNLLLAYNRVSAGDDKGAVAPLHEAAHSLADFEQQDHGSIGQQAEDMRQDIEGMAHNIRHDASLDRIGDWLRTVERWQQNRRVQFPPPQPWVK